MIENILRNLVAINTIEDKENEKINNYIEDYLKKLGFKTELKTSNLIMSIKDTYPIGFLSHTDTVKASTNWQTDPFELIKKENKLYGLGSCDMKGGIAAILYVLSQIDFEKLNYGLKLYFTHDEEISFKGIKEIKNLNFPKTMIIPEPTNNVPIVCTKGLLEYKITFKGIRVHASNPIKGKNAIYDAIEFINQMKTYLNSNLKQYRNEAFEIPYTTMNLGKINGGDSINSTAEKCEIYIDFRTTKASYQLKIIEKINTLLKKYDAKAEILENIYPMINENDISSIEAISNNKASANYITEASLIDSNSIILGPGPITAHEANEYIDIDSLNKSAKIYKFIIENISNL